MGTTGDPTEGAVDCCAAAPGGVAVKEPDGELACSPDSEEIIRRSRLKYILAGCRNLLRGAVTKHTFLSDVSPALFDVP